MSIGKPAATTWQPCHFLGNCGVGVTQLAWGKQATDACPRCGAPENTLHVLTCSAEDADSPWTENISKLQTFLREVDTCPHIIKVLNHRLTQLRAGDLTLLSPWFPPEVRRAMAAQDRIGWKNLLEGIPAKHWILAQSRHYKRICVTHTNGRRWMKQLLKHLHTLAHGQWQHRNAVMFDPDKKQQQAALALLKQCVAEEFNRGRQHLPTRDCSHFAFTLPALLNKQPGYLQSWFLNVTAARHRQARRQGATDDEIASSPTRTDLITWCKTRRFLPTPTSHENPV